MNVTTHDELWSGKRWWWWFGLGQWHWYGCRVLRLEHQVSLLRLERGEKRDNAKQQPIIIPWINWITVYLAIPGEGKCLRGGKTKSSFCLSCSMWDYLFWSQPKMFNRYFPVSWNSRWGPAWYHLKVKGIWMVSKSWGLQKACDL